MPKIKTNPHSGLTIVLEIHGQLPPDPVERVTEVVKAMLSITNRVIDSTGVPSCAAYQAMIAIMVEEMMDNDHVSCAADLIQGLALEVAKKQREQGAAFDS